MVTQVHLTLPDNSSRPAQVLAAVLLRGVIPNLPATASAAGPSVPFHKVVLSGIRAAGVEKRVDDVAVAALLCVQVIDDSIAAPLVIVIVNIISAACGVQEVEINVMRGVRSAADEGFFSNREVVFIAIAVVIAWYNKIVAVFRVDATTISCLVVGGIPTGNAVVLIKILI